MVSMVLGANHQPSAHETWPPDDPVDYSVSYRPREKGSFRHFGFFPFFAKKPWQVVQEYIKHYSRPGDLVGDPFAGSGVTPVEALVLGRRAITSDINPVARFITRMTATAPVDLQSFHAAFKSVQAMSQRAIESLDELAPEDLAAILRTLNFPRDPIPAGVRRADIETVDRLHTPRQLAGLTLLRDAINTVDDPLNRDLLRVALANAARYANIMYILPFDPSGKRRSPFRGDVGFLRRFSYSPASDKLFYEHRVWQVFERGVDAVRRAKEETNRLIGARYNEPNFVLADVPASRFHEIAGEATLDYCFTDPPYSNEIRFLGLSTLWAAWLGMEISDRDRRAELLIDPSQGKTRGQFEQEFAASVASIARSLKDERWLTLVYKHRDLTLWQSIKEACESSGLCYVNAIWQNVSIPSTRQNESPNINPKGDMYLNFRKMPRRRFEMVYGRADVLTLPTRANYLEHEVERLIVSYLGADIELITSHVVQQVLDSRAFRNENNPLAVTQDLQQVLASKRFTTWRAPGGAMQWVLAPGIVPDVTLDPTDRARYHVFNVLRERESATEGEVAQYVLTQMANESTREPVRATVPLLLQGVGQLVSPRRWRFDVKRVSSYKQLRLFFRTSLADELRERLEAQAHQGAIEAIRPNLEELILLRDRLEAANTKNVEFKEQFDHLMGIILTILSRLKSKFGDQIERVVAIGDWAFEGIDLRNLPYDDVILSIVLRSNERPFALYTELARDVFSGLEDDDIVVQFQLQTRLEWDRAQGIRPSPVETGVALLDRS